MDVTPMIFELYTPEGKGIIAEMDEKGVVTFAVEAGEGSSIRGTEMFNRMVDHFGSGLTAIHGVWVKGTLGKASTNIDKVNELTARGMRLEDAIQQAWTVTRAAKRGYRQVRLMGNPIGQPGGYIQVDVLIER